MEVFAIPLIFAVVLAYVGYRQWLRQQQRLLVHRERLSALERGAELPPWPAEQTRQALGMEGFLLLSGLIWLALGIGGMIAAFAIVPNLDFPDRPPAAIALLGIPAALVGVAHLIVYQNYRKKKE
jgi:uncharacterized membrane protein YfcA